MVCDGQVTTWCCAGSPMLGQNLVVGVGGVEKVHPIPHDQAGPCLLVGGLPFQYSLTVAQGTLHLVHCLLHFTLQLCHGALDPALSVLRAAMMSQASRMQWVPAKNDCLASVSSSSM